MLKMIIESEIKTQGIDPAILLNGICTEGEFSFWEQEETIMQEEELLLGVMQVHALA